MTSGRAYAAVIICINAAVLLCVSAWFFLAPAASVTLDVRDDALRSGGVPRSAWRIFESLTPVYEHWARERIASSRAAGRPVTDISGTEWPVFGSAFYLWSVESLEDAWLKDRSVFPVEPKLFARDAVEAAKDLIIDPSSAGWVKKYWGDGYLHRENVFYRMLIIAGLTSHKRLTGWTGHLAELRDQVETLSAEIDASPTGLLDDYPGQCYSTDVIAAVTMIRRADAVLGTDHSAFVTRALRGFRGDALAEPGLPPYLVDSRTGKAIGVARGCSNSYACMFAPEIWPDAARKWYDLYVKHFWQHRWMTDGFREFPEDVPGGEWYFDVDSGPVIAGHGVSACAFGLAAARTNGRFDQAYPLAAEALAASWPLPDGTLAMARLLSNATDAPLVAEAAILFALTREPVGGPVVRATGGPPGFVYALIAIYLGVGLAQIFCAVVKLRSLRRLRVGPPRAARTQFALWGALVVGSAGSVLFGPAAPILLLTVAQLFPLGLPRPPKPQSGSETVPGKAET
jgi:hypothetical protein